MTEKVVSERKQSLLKMGAEAHYVKHEAIQVLTLLGDLKKVEDLGKKYTTLLDKIQLEIEERLDYSFQQLQKTCARMQND